MIKEREIREALGMKTELPMTARGRAQMDGKAINIEPDEESIKDCAKKRAYYYSVCSRELANDVRANKDGITTDELEAVEFVREQLRHLAKKAMEQFADLL